MLLHRDIHAVVAALEQNGGRTYIVGGAVRDHQLGLGPKDIDLEIFGLPFEVIQRTVLSLGFPCKKASKSFPVLITSLGDQQVEISIPRRERKKGVGHTDFEVIPDPFMTELEAVMRRDFTINTLMYRPALGKVLDPTGKGFSDLRNRILRAVGPQFAEDALRVLRGAQFCARFGLTAEPRTLDMCLALRRERQFISAERIWEEWYKLFSKGLHPSLGIRFLIDCGWISPIHNPEIYSLIGIPQDPVWHPEGDVFTHTMMVMDAAAKIAIEERLESEDRCVLVASALCHDFGKVTHTFWRDGRWRSPGHDVAGVDPTRRFLEDIGMRFMGGQGVFLKRVETLVRFHMVHTNYKDPSKKAIRKLVNKLERGHSSLKELSLVVTADARGCGGEKTPDSVLDMLRVYESMPQEEVSACVNPIVTGKHLITLGLEPGPQFGKLLAQLMDRQLNDEFSTVEDGLVLLQEELL